MRDEILDVFLEFKRDENNSILISSHIIRDLEKICDRITFIHNGKIVFTDEKDVILERYTIVKCSKSDVENIDKTAVVGKREGSFGVEVLVRKDKIGRGYVTDHTGIEDIMRYLSKEVK